MEAYQLEKACWDDADFTQMGWHDATVWSFLANPDRFEFLLDLDYIFEWVKPQEDESFFKFGVAPATMVFSNAHSVVIDIQSPQGTIEIFELHRGEPESTPNEKVRQRLYRFECQEGAISLMATGFAMFVRCAPELLEVQSLSLSQRGGVSFKREME